MKEYEYLFFMNKGETGVNALLRRLTRKIGIKVTPLMLRHKFANESRINSKALKFISKALGQKLETTRNYINISNKELVDATDG